MQRRRQQNNDSNNIQQQQQQQQPQPQQQQKQHRTMSTSRKEQSPLATNLQLKYVILVTLMIIVAFTLSNTDNKVLVYYFGGENNNNDDSNVQYYFSLGRLDGEGSVIHDMLMAHAFAFHRNEELHEARIRIIKQQQEEITNNTNDARMPIISETKILLYNSIQYGGACLEPSNSSFRQTRVRLIHGLLQAVGVVDNSLKFAVTCPKSSGSSNDENNKYITLPRLTYREKFDSELFTEKWRRSILAPQSSSSQTQSLLMKKNEDSDHQKQIFRIVVHIRRGDVNPCIYIDRYLPNQHYLRLIEQYSSGPNHTNNNTNSTLNEKDVEVIIFSESSSYEPFDEFIQRGFIVKLDTSLEEAWKTMAEASVLIMSRSSFSFVPALLNPNARVVYTPFWHGKPRFNESNMWKTVDPELMELTNHELQEQQKYCMAMNMDAFSYFQK